MEGGDLVQQPVHGADVVREQGFAHQPDNNANVMTVSSCVLMLYYSCTCWWRAWDPGVPPPPRSTGSHKWSQNQSSPLNIQWKYVLISNNRMIFLTLVTNLRNLRKYSKKHVSFDTRKSRSTLESLDTMLTSCRNPRDGLVSSRAWAQEDYSLELSMGDGTSRNFTMLGECSYFSSW